MLFAQLLTTSPELVAQEVKLRVLSFMEEFLKTASYEDIREGEVKNGYKWSTLVPFMKLAYHPSAPSRPSSDGDQLETSIQEKLNR